MVVAAPDRVNSALGAAERGRGQECFGAEAARALAGEPLFAPLAGLLAALPSERFGNLEPLNAMLAAVEPRPCARSGRAIRFVRPDDSRLGYERRIHASGEVVTRPDNWHDFFNALVWLLFPRAKAQLNALHVDEMAAGGGALGRGARRDAATQFDESGVAVLASDRSLLDLLEARRWHELFWQRRKDVIASMRFLVFGHGLYDALRSPFYRMCGRAALIPADPAIIRGDALDQCRHADAVLAQRFAGRAWYPRPRSLPALPLLGIPGVCPQNEAAEYYLDTLQFRPRPAFESGTIAIASRGPSG
jgi:hypothetical protein